MILKRLLQKLGDVIGRPRAEAPWLDMLNSGTFPMGHEEAFKYTSGQIPIPNEVLRQTVSRPDLGGFYFIGESWSLVISQLLQGLPGPHFNVLDVGCGVGKTARFLTLDPRINYIGFDIFKPAIDWANDAFSPVVGRRFQFVHFDGISKFYNPGGTIPATEYQFPAEDETVDLAFAASLFTHLYEDDMRAYLRQTARVLTPHGLALYSIKEVRGDQAQEPISGTEQSIEMTRDFFVQCAREEGLELHDPGRVICGQRAVVLRKA
ncbi:class I SAM-dependent methyltransferase [Tateyamaria sp. syn59]|uniref:class I SAM-dependent methyltransferase n=1 Tax=Tateyamaria sp. syn59 TaxID=2576942 RepID=UPI0011BF351B|nr:class I SAM-dependent methyltransferase [Tateyamaria sp. syn59]